MTNPLRAALMGALMTLPLAGTALAADVPAADTMHGMDMHTMATMVCRPAQTNEKATAMAMSDKSPLVCKPVADMMKSMPTMDPSMTAQQMNEAWHRFASSALTIPFYGP